MTDLERLDLLIRETLPDHEAHGLDDLDEAELRDLLQEAGRRPAPGAV